METKFFNALYDKVFFDLPTVQQVDPYKSDIREIFKKQKKYQNKKVCLYGAGEFSEFLSKSINLKSFNPFCFIDNDNAKVGEFIDGIEIRHISELTKIKPDVILITTLESEYIMSELRKNSIIQELNIELNYL